MNHLKERQQLISKILGKKIIHAYFSIKGVNVYQNLLLFEILKTSVQKKITHRKVKNSINKYNIAFTNKDF